MDNSIIIIDDDNDFLEIIKMGLITSGFNNVRTEDNPIKVASLFGKGEIFDIALIDMTMPEMDGMKLLEIIKNTSPNTECVMVTAVNEAKVAVQCLKKGAYDYLVKPTEKEELVSSISRALERKRLLDILDIEKGKVFPKLRHKDSFNSITTKSHNVLKVLKEAELHAVSDVPVLITGESGTGKELLARAIHDVSPRAQYPFSPINMASLSGSLFDAELFGHTKGAFTGAEKDRAGYIEHTEQGTLFLDEIGNLPVELQGKLLRVLQDGEYIKLGTSAQKKADVRFIAATNEDLSKLITRKMFRKDLYYRLRGGWLHLPPLRERQDDIPLLINVFLEEFCNGSIKHGIEEETIALLLNYNYPGNIRELKSIIQSAVNLSQGRPISANCLPQQLRVRKAMSKVEYPVVIDSIVPLEQVEKSHILKTYNQVGCNKSKTAKLLGIGLNTLRRRLESYGVK